jgi:pimeloyl-ACP methyl ester carboxylesterase
MDCKVGHTNSRIAHALRLITVPYLGYALFRVVGTRAMLGTLHQNKCKLDIYKPDADPELTEEIMRKLEWQIKEKKGFLDAFHSCLYNFNFHDLSDTYSSLPQVPAVCFWGKEDAIIPSASAERFRELVPQSTVHVLAETGHSVVLEPETKTATFETLHEWLLQTN